MFVVLLRFAENERLIGGTGIVRHRGKIETFINNAHRVPLLA